jgi:error-prone DNA polymerase
MAGLFTHDPGMYPKRLLLAEARRLGVSILPIDVNKSSDEYRTEKTDQGIGVRMALTDIQGISDAEVERIIAEQPFADLPDFYLRAKPSRRSLEHLATLGAFDSLIGLSSSADPISRGNILARVRQLNAIKTRPKNTASQTVLDFSVLDTLPTGNPDLNAAERVEAELAITKLDVSGHILDSFRPMLDEMGVIRSDELVALRSKTDVLVAGVRVATQTPPMRSGKRVVFLTLDDGHGCSDATFFEEAQKRSSRILFNNKLLLISGKTRRTGVKGVSIMAENAWDLRDLWAQWVKQKEVLGYSERIA